MATVHIAFGTAMAAGAPAYPRTFSKVEVITSSGSSQATSIKAEGGEYAHITPSGGDVHVDVGPSPVAVRGSPHLVCAGNTKLIGVLKEGDKVAILNV